MKRELDVLRLVAEGRSSNEIARTLFISKETVKSHRASILRRLNAKNSAHAVSIAIKKSII